MANQRKTVRLLLLDDEVPNSIHASGRAVFVGDANVDYLCAACDSPLCLGMREGDLTGLAFLCGCGRTNLVPWPAERAEGLAAP